MIPVRRLQAFTLIEMLVAMAVFAILAALAYGVLSQTIINSELMNARMDRLKALQKTVRVLSEDFMQLNPRPVRQELGGSISAALTTDFQTTYAVELTRAGWNNPLVLPRPTLQRAAYRLEADELIRYHWNVLDRTLANEPVAEVLIDGVESIVFRFYPTSGEPVEQWPPQNTPGIQGARQRPRAVQIILSLVSEGEITRLIEVAP